MIDAYIYDGLRTPFGRHAGALAPIRPDDIVLSGSDQPTRGAVTSYWKAFCPCPANKSIGANKSKLLIQRTRIYDFPKL